MATSAVPTLAAKFDSMETARSAIERLENSGVDGADIQLVGEGAKTSRRPDPKTEDRRIGRYVAPRIATGTVLGCVFGAAIGLIVGIVMVAAADVAGGVMAACVVAGAVIGAVAGSFIGLERRVGFTDEWTRTFDEPSRGPLWVAVRARDAATFDRARHALRTVGPLELRSNRAAVQRN